MPVSHRIEHKKVIITTFAPEENDLKLFRVFFPDIRKSSNL